MMAWNKHSFYVICGFDEVSKTGAFAVSPRSRDDGKKINLPRMNEDVRL